MPMRGEKSEGNKNVANGLLDLKIIRRQQGVRRKEIKNSKNGLLRNTDNDKNRQAN
jgi:hypothetical protein